MRGLWISLLLTLAACRHGPDPQAFLAYQASFLRPGVDLEKEEGEVRRVLAQRGVRINARLAQNNFIALAGATRDRRVSALRVITPRGTMLAEDAATDDLFQPSSLSLFEHFGGTLGPYVLVAYARVPAGLDVGCVTLQRVLADGHVVPCVLDVSELGARACVANLAPGRNGRMRAKIAWPSLHALVTPQLDVELAFDDPNQGRVELLTSEEPLPPPNFAPTARIAKSGEWMSNERDRLGTLRLSKATFSQRHAAGVARAAMARLDGRDRGEQISAYRYAVGDIPPGGLEARVVAETLAHIQHDWLDGPASPANAADPSRPAPPPQVEEEPIPEDALVIDPSADE